MHYVENIKSTNFILGTNTKSTYLQIHEFIIFNKTTKIDAHEEKYFHSILATKVNKLYMINAHFSNIKFTIQELCLIMADTISSTFSGGPRSSSGTIIFNNL